MWLRNQPDPILYGSSRKDTFGSEKWVAKGTIQKIGAITFAAGLFSGSIALLFAGVFLRAEISQSTGGVLGQAFGIGLALLALLVAGTAMLLTFRLVRGVVRSFYK
jgi:hypothetical protein